MTSSDRVHEGSDGSPDAQWRADWEHALAELELDLEVADRLLDHGELPQVDPWVAPVMRRPMPHDLLPRAKDIQQRQLRTAARIVEQMTANRKQREFTAVVDAERTHASVYLDVSA